jgi:hypothetical protein
MQEKSVKTDEILIYSPIFCVYDYERKRNNAGFSETIH